ncbi:MAG TPA: WD40 repeat domain-containing protein, partial [Gemmataceae bacterium]|nr:WD40 repeat domain-containing protein [Gemmataceae bacterium]
MTAVRSLLAVGMLFAGAAAGLADPPPTVAPELPITRGVHGPVKLIRMATDGSWAAFTAVPHLGDPRGSFRVQVWDLRSGALDRSVLMPEAWNWGAAVVSPDGKWLAYHRQAEGSFRVQLVDLRTGRLAATTPEPKDHYYYPLGFSADGTEVYSVTTNGTGGIGGNKVVVWSTADGSKLREVKVPSSDVIVLSPDGKTVAVGKTELWDLTTGKRLHGPEVKPLKGEYPVFLRGGKEIALNVTWTAPYPTLVYDVATGKQVAEVVVSKDLWMSPRLLSEDHKLVVVLRRHYDLEVYEVGRDEPRFGLPEFTRWLDRGDARFTPDGKGLLVRDWFGRVTLLDTTTGKRIHTFDTDYRTVRSLAFADGGKVLLAGMAHHPHLHNPSLNPRPEGHVVVWDTASGELTRATGGVSDDLRAVYPSP